jgi:Zn-dependent M16 (insulinase) family peptidase
MANGPLWTACRTNGYAYNVTFDFDFNTNLILLSINRCSQVKLAYSSAIETLKNLVQQKTNFDSKQIDAARNLTICMLTENLSTLGRVRNVCIRSYLNTYSIEKYQELINEINLFNYTEDILLYIIDDRQSSTLMLVNTNKMKETQEFIQKEYDFKNVILIKDVVKHLCR